MMSPGFAVIWVVAVAPAPPPPMPVALVPVRPSEPAPVPRSTIVPPGVKSLGTVQEVAAGVLKILLLPPVCDEAPPAIRPPEAEYGRLTAAELPRRSPPEAEYGRTTRARPPSTRPPAPTSGRET